MKLLRVCSAILCVVLFFSVFQFSGGAEVEKINNADLMPRWMPDDQVAMDGDSPEWVKSLIVAQFRVEAVSEAGDFDSAIKVLDHYQEMGVNGIWLNPIYQRSDKNRRTINNGYAATEPDMVDERIAGTKDKEEGWAAARRFVDEAHARNIRVLLDIVVWGVDKTSSLVTQHPEWFQRNGEFINSWGNYGYNLDNADCREWYIQNAVNILMKSGADGFRCDLEPSISGYDLWKEVRRRCYAQGRKIIIVSEITNKRIDGVYDFEQIGVNLVEGKTWESGNYFMKNNIVDCIKSGTGIGHKALSDAGQGGLARYYTYNLASHDSLQTTVRGSKVRMGYQALFAPFIPFWFIGEEWNNPTNISTNGVLFFNEINWAAKEKPENAQFFEDVKRMLRIRRQYPELFEYFPENHREANICAVKVDGNYLQCYARYAGGKGIIVVPNNNGEKAWFKVYVPFEEMGIGSSEEYVVTDLFSGREMARGTREEVAEIYVETQHDDLLLLLVEKVGGGSENEATEPTENDQTTAGDTTTTRAGESSVTDAARAADTEKASSVGTTVVIACAGVLLAALLATGGVAVAMRRREKTAAQPPEEKEESSDEHEQ